MKFSAAQIGLFITGYLLLLGASAGLTQGTDVEHYRIPLFSHNTTFTTPRNTCSYGFNVLPGMHVTASPRLSVHYNYSPVLLSSESQLIVSFNGVPLVSQQIRGLPELADDQLKNHVSPLLASRNIDKYAAADHLLEVSLPLHLLKQGYNEVTLFARHGTVVGEDSGVEDKENWITFFGGVSPSPATEKASHKSAPGVAAGKIAAEFVQKAAGSSSMPASTISMTIKRQSGYPLYLYPYPFMDALALQAVKSTWYLPLKPSPTTIEAMLYLASDWGCRAPKRDLGLKVSTASPLEAKNGHQVLIGETSAWPSQLGPRLGKGMGWLGTLPSNNPGRQVRLLVTGDGAEGMRKAVQFLAAPEVVSQLEVQSTTVQEAPQLHLDASPFRRDGITLAELGTPSLSITEEEIHRHATLQLQRPVRCDLGRKSYLRVNFHHSAALNYPAQTQLIVTVNDDKNLAVRIPLNVGNMEGGELTVPIPLTELPKTSWTIDFSISPDSNPKDTASLPDSSSWVIIDGATEFNFSEGAVPGTPFLNHFPYLVAKDGKVMQPVIFWLPTIPSDAQLTTAALIAARAGQENHQPITWRVVLGDPPKLEHDTAAAVIMLADLQDIKRCAAMKSALLVYPDSPDHVVFDNKLQRFSTALLSKASAVMQAVPLPAAPKQGIIYTLLVRDGKAVNEKLALREQMDTLNGEVALLSAPAGIICDSTRSKADIQQDLKREAGRYDWLMYTIVILILIALVQLLRWIIQQFFPKNNQQRQRPPMPATPVTGMSLAAGESEPKIP